MQFDTQQHKELVVALIEQASFPGKLIEVAAELKKSVAAATVETPSADPS